MPARRKDSKRRKSSVPDLNREVASALGAITSTELPKGEDLLGGEELKREYRETKAKTPRLRPAKP